MDMPVSLLDKRELMYVYIVLIAVLIILLILLGLVTIYIVFPCILNDHNIVHTGRDTITMPISASGPDRIEVHVSPVMKGKSLVSAQSGFFHLSPDFTRIKNIIYIKGV